MTRAPLNQLSAVEIVAAVATGEMSCEAVASACVERVVARENTVKAWAYFEPELVLAAARELDKASVRGPLHGLPVGVKDIIDTADMPTQMGSPIYRGYRPSADASCVAMLRAAGALIFGKTVTCEFAGVTAGETTNPHDPARTPGGSSSGSGAAVADSMVPLALGTQTGGSVLRPSAFCGIVGYKPSFGLINRAGVKPAAESLDTVGLMARTVEDLALAFRILTNADAIDWLPPETSLRIGLCRTSIWDTAEGATKDAVLDGASRLRSLGHTVEDCDLPVPFNELSLTREIVNDYERARAMAHEWQKARSLISEGLRRSIGRGFAMPAERYVNALRHIASCRRVLPAIFEKFDVLLAPTVQGEAPSGLSFTGDHHFQSIWTQLRTPAVTLPTHTGPHGMPVGVQLVGPVYGDGKLLAIARLIFACLGPGPTIDVTKRRQVG